MPTLNNQCYHRCFHGTERSLSTTRQVSKDQPSGRSALRMRHSKAFSWRSDKMALEELQLIEGQMDQLDHEIADLLSQHQDAVQRLAEVPGLGVDSAHQIIAEVGAKAATFPSEKHLASWIGICPGEEESAGISASNRCPKGNRFMRRLLNQAANAAVKAKGSIFEIVFRRMLPRLGFKKAIGAIAHRLTRLIWKILHQGVRYEERGTAVSRKSRAARTTKMIKELRSLGYRVEPMRTPA